MKINYSKKLLDQDGAVLKIDNKDELTVKTALQLTFWRALEEDRGLSPDQLYTLRKIQIKVNKEKDLSADDITKVIARCAKVYSSPAVFGQIYETLENISDEAEDKKEEAKETKEETKSV